MISFAMYSSSLCHFSRPALFTQITNVTVIKKQVNYVRGYKGGIIRSGVKNVIHLGKQILMLKSLKNKDRVTRLQLPSHLCIVPSR
ncbi:hypothetical protein HOLleu_07478 [Holothuria leucospilota]|uniref:Uncharacterized protein n=1 Tax=Holothuria leucospilota TaxID=206669 RepID=A0A9Q1CG26_HOLLE|nr:hypothetical protein HOLleu_07478 [Holothuria leucospilota]